MLNVRTYCSMYGERDSKIPIKDVSGDQTAPFRKLCSRKRLGKMKVNEVVQDIVCHIIILI